MANPPIEINFNRDRINRRIGELSQPQIEDAMKRVVERAKNAVPPGKSQRSENGEPIKDTPLQDTIGYDPPTIQGDKVIGRIYAEGDNAEVIHVGRKTIRVKRGQKKMVWFAPGKVARVTSKGVSARPFLTNAALSVFGGRFKLK